MTRIVMTKNQLKFLPLMITFKRNATISTEARERKSGFTINWSLESSNGSQLTEKLPARAKDWKKGEARQEDHIGVLQVSLPP